MRIGSENEKICASTLSIVFLRPLALLRFTVIIESLGWCIVLFDSENEFFIVYF